MSEFKDVYTEIKEKNRDFCLRKGAFFDGKNEEKSVKKAIEKCLEGEEIRKGILRSGRPPWRPCSSDPRRLHRRNPW